MREMSKPDNTIWDAMEAIALHSQTFVSNDSDDNNMYANIHFKILLAKKEGRLHLFEKV